MAHISSGGAAMTRTTTDNTDTTNNADNTADAPAKPLTGSRSTAGFPSPADDYIEGALDLNRLLIKHPAATFFMRADGAALQSAGIVHRDLLIVDRSRRPVSGSIVVALIDGELQLRRFGESTNEIWGVVTCVIHELD